MRGLLVAICVAVLCGGARAADAGATPQRVWSINRFASLRAQPKLDGTSCRLEGVVSHVSAIQSNLVMIASVDRPWEGALQA